MYYISMCGLYILSDIITIQVLLAVDAALQLVASEMRLDRTDSRLQQNVQDGQVQRGLLLRFQLSL